MTMHLALIGKGRWGTNIANTLSTFDNVRVTCVGVGETAPADIDGVLIATPSPTHVELALPFIEKGIPTFIEKPIATSTKDAEAVKDAAEKSGGSVFVGHIYLHNPAFLKIRDLLPQLGSLRYIVSEKMNHGPRQGESVFWDWLPHDLSMGIYLFGKPKAVTAHGIGSKTTPRHYDLGVATFEYADVSFCSIVHWRSLEKRKRTTFVGKLATLVFDDVADKKLILYTGDVISYPDYLPAQPLTNELKAFISAIESKTKSEEIEIACTVVRGTEAAQESALLGVRVQL